MSYKTLLPSCTAFCMASYYVLFAFLSVLVLLLGNAAPAEAQSPAPAPPGPLNVSAVLEKGGRFTTLIRLMRSTQVESRVNGQLNDSNNGMTIFAPSDNAFASLKPGTLNGLTDQEKASLIQFHIIPNYLSLSSFQTVSNPLRTEAGDIGPFNYPLNVTSMGNSINITTGINNATVSNTVYTDGQLAVYEVDKVLMPLGIFGPKPPAVAPSPAPAKAKKKKSTAVAPSSNVDSSGVDAGLRSSASAVVALVAAALLGGFCLS